MRCADPCPIAQIFHFDSSLSQAFENLQRQQVSKCRQRKILQLPNFKKIAIASFRYKTALHYKNTMNNWIHIIPENSNPIVLIPNRLSSIIKNQLNMYS